MTGKSSQGNSQRQRRDEPAAPEQIDTGDEYEPDADEADRFARVDQIVQPEVGLGQGHDEASEREQSRRGNQPGRWPARLARVHSDRLARPLLMV